MAVSDLRRKLLAGLAIPAHPLALTSARKFDERSQEALTRYYLESGAGGLAVGVHTTQFTIRSHGLYRPVLELAAEVARSPSPVMIAGVAGPTKSAVAEAGVAADLGYDAVLVAPHGFEGNDKQLADHYRHVGEVLPTLGFYLQPAVGGRKLSLEFWAELLSQPELVAIKVAPFDTEETRSVARVLMARRRSDVALYTGNDNRIVEDLALPILEDHNSLYFAGGLLGHWAIWTKCAVDLFHECRAAREDAELRNHVLDRADRVSEMNAAVFDSANEFKGCIAGLQYVLWKQGLISSAACLDPGDRLSPGQAALIDDVQARYPSEIDDEFVRDNLSSWKR